MTEGGRARGAALLVACNVSTLAWPTGGYHGTGIGPPEGARLLGLHVSPSRGLFIYCPLALLALGALSRRTRPTALRWFALAMPVWSSSRSAAPPSTAAPRSPCR